MISGERVLLNLHTVREHLIPVQTAAVQSFHRQLPGYQETPLHDLTELARDLQLDRLFVKDESVRLGLPAFKILGASWATYRTVCSRLGYADDHAPSLETVRTRACEQGLLIFAATAGNHGRAVAYTARLLGIPVHIFVPQHLDEYTKLIIRNQGAEIHDSTHYDQAVKDAEVAATKADGLLIQDTAWPGYEQVPNLIIDGYTTMFKEIDDQLANLGVNPTHIITPVGVGSLAHAVVKHYKSDAHGSVRIMTVEPRNAACLFVSLSTSHSITINTTNTIMNGMNCGTVSTTAWPDLRDHIDAAIVVNDIDAHEGVLKLDEYKIEAGPCGGASLAALQLLTPQQRSPLGLDASSVVVLLCTEGKRPYNLSTS